MKWSIRRKQLNTSIGLLASAAAHLFMVIVFALLLAPLAGNRAKVVEVDAGFVDIGEEFNIVELAALPTVVPQVQPTWEAMPVDADPLEVVHPGLVHSSGRGGRGHSSANTGSSTGLSRGAGDANATSFFGTQARGNSFVYVLDISTSMNAARIKRAMLELLRSIDELHEYQHFYVITFSWKTRFMFDDQSLLPTPIPATFENKQRLRAWLAGLKTGSGTDPRAALRVGLRMRPDALFLLSDGEFNTPDPGSQSDPVPAWLLGDSSKSVIEVVRNSDSMALPIHTIAFEERRHEKEMQLIASETRGMHRFVAPNPSKTMESEERTVRTAVLRYRFWAEGNDELVRSKDVRP